MLLTDKVEAIVVTTRQDGRTVLDNHRWPEHIEVSGILMGGRDDVSMTREGLFLYFWLANGCAQYRIQAYDASKDTFDCYLVDSTYKWMGG